MIRFSIHTYRAEINAMPCPPNEFEIVISGIDRIMDQRFREPRFDGYSYSVRDCQFDSSITLRFTRVEQTNHSTQVHQMILDKFLHNMNPQYHIFRNGKCECGHRAVNGEKPCTRKKSDYV